MGVYVDISFNAKLTDFGYEIVQELYRNRNEGKLPTVELYQEEEYDDDGNLIASNHIELEKIFRRIYSFGTAIRRWTIFFLYKLRHTGV